ncbi:glutamate receptor 2.8-like [Rhododendron vialii]|uniref:glutamate receptor 2.8-like n=1 Tax=Rhododendron vialii TaxID=182163 RepID=UPI00265E3F58|nr:glutamate receptor 2.8-like [Rhododendron vialii]
MPFQLRSSTKPIFLFIPILLISSLVILSQVSVVEGGSTEHKTQKLIIGVPGNASFKNFVKITSSSQNPNEKNYTGFCVRVFEEVWKRLGYPVTNYEFVEFNGAYDDLVANVANKTYSAAVGDITILAERWKDVEFTEPFTESGLSMVVPVKPSQKAWMFLEPFTLGMWLAAASVLVYTMFIVWFVEHRSNPDFSGPWNDQLGNALWFTFSSLFLAHREKIQSNYARIVVVVWLFLALVLTQSYTANLTSMLTISRLRPKLLSHSNVGCDESSFMKKYVEGVLNYKNVSLIRDEDAYLRAFETGSISAAFLEIPYAKDFVNRNCRKFSIVGTTYRFGGFGFIFQKGCGLAADVSKAILELSENGTLKMLEEEWLTPDKECLKSETTTENIDSLSLQNFWGLFLFSAATSSICFLLFLGHLVRDYLRHQSSQVADVNASNESVSIKTVRVARYLMNAEIGSPWRSPSSNRAVLEIDMC